MFSISSKNISGFNTMVLGDSRTATGVVVVPESGAIVNNWHIQHKGEAIDIICGYSSRQDWLQSLTAKGFRSAKLSPWVGRLANGSYPYIGQQFTIDDSFYLGRHALHGLLYNKAFSIEEIFAGEECARLKLLYTYMGEDKGYPFRYKCYITYELHHKKRLRIITEIINTDATSIPVADGWHPYFNLQCPVDELELSMTSRAKLEMNDEILPTGNKPAFDEYLQPKQIGDRHFDDCFLLDFAKKDTYVKIRNKSIDLSVVMVPDPNYPFVQLYTPESRSSIALECLSGAPDAFNNNIGLHHLPMGAEIRFSVDYRVV